MWSHDSASPSAAPPLVITDYHAKYFAYELGRRCSSDSVEKLTAVLADAQVDLNPHQIEVGLPRFNRHVPYAALVSRAVQSLSRAVQSLSRAS